MQLGTWINLVRNPAVLTLLQAAGLDYARVDMEHSSPSMETVADMAVLGRALGFPVIVRPPVGSRGVDHPPPGRWGLGLHIPQVDTPAIAREVLQAARYAPAGQRGMAGLGPHNDFAPSGDLRRDQALLNEQVHLTVMLESATAFGHLDEIVATPGVDAVTLGRPTWPRRLGVLGTPRQGAVIDEHRLRLIEGRRAHGKDVAMLVQTLEEAERWIAPGPGSSPTPRTWPSCAAGSPRPSTVSAPP